MKILVLFLTFQLCSAIEDLGYLNQEEHQIPSQNVFLSQWQAKASPQLTQAPPVVIPKQSKWHPWSDKSVKSEIKTKKTKAGNNNRLSTQKKLNKFLNVQQKSKKSCKVQDLQVSCSVNENEMKVKFLFDGDFAGLIYAKGHFKINGCRIRGEGTSSTIAFVLPLDGCGCKEFYEGDNLKTGTMGFEYILVVMCHASLGILEGESEAYKVSCFMGGDGGAKLNTKLQVPMIDFKSVDPNKIVMPPAVMFITEGKNARGTRAQVLKLGQVATLSITSHNLGEMFDLKVHDCFAHDGMDMGWVELIDSNGCAANPKIIGPLQKTFSDNGDIVIFTYFKVFKFPDVQNVYFECGVEFCVKQCTPANCYEGIQVKNGVKRSRRSASNSSEIQRYIFQSVSVEIPGEFPEEGLSKKVISTPISDKQEAVKFCVSHASFVSVFVLLALLFVSFTMFSIYICRFQRSNQNKKFSSNELT